MEEIYKALGDPTRLRILGMLASNGETCVCKLVEELRMGQPAISHHMAALRHAGLVNGRKAGQWIHYSLNRDALIDGPLAHLQGLLNSGPKPVVVVLPEENCCADEMATALQERR